MKQTTKCIIRCHLRIAFLLFAMLIVQPAYCTIFDQYAKHIEKEVHDYTLKKDNPYTSTYSVDPDHPILCTIKVAQDAQLDLHTIPLDTCFFIMKYLIGEDRANIEFTYDKFKKSILWTNRPRGIEPASAIDQELPESARETICSWDTLYMNYLIMEGNKIMWEWERKLVEIYTRAIVEGDSIQFESYTAVNIYWPKDSIDSANSKKDYRNFRERLDKYIEKRKQIEAQQQETIFTKFAKWLKQIFRKIVRWIQF